MGTHGRSLGCDFLRDGPALVNVAGGVAAAQEAHLGTLMAPGQLLQPSQTRYRATVGPLSVAF